MKEKVGGTSSSAIDMSNGKRERQISLGCGRRVQLYWVQRCECFLYDSFYLFGMSNTIAEHRLYTDGPFLVGMLDSILPQRLAAMNPSKTEALQSIETDDAAQGESFMIITSSYIK